MKAIHPVSDLKLRVDYDDYRCNPKLVVSKLIEVLDNGTFVYKDIYGFRAIRK